MFLKSSHADGSRIRKSRPGHSLSPAQVVEGGLPSLAKWAPGQPHTLPCGYRAAIITWVNPSLLWVIWLGYQEPVGLLLNAPRSPDSCSCPWNLRGKGEGAGPFTQDASWFLPLEFSRISHSPPCLELSGLLRYASDSFSIRLRWDLNK